MQYTARWIYERLRSMGFGGSYEIVKRRVGHIKAERQKVAYMRFETEPGYQGQVDFGEFQVESADGSIKKLHVFSMILGYSREIYAELVDRCDLAMFLDCHIRAFDHFGGVPEQILYDRMKNVFIGKYAGKSRFNATLMGFALHYGFKPEVAPAYAAWVKGKVERPYTFIREGFWRGYGFVCIETANRDLNEWLKEKSERVHGTTHEVVSPPGKCLILRDCLLKLLIHLTGYAEGFKKIARYVLKATVMLSLIGLWTKKLSCVLRIRP